MKLTIHRGAHEIGGSCVQISAGGRSVLLDAGSPLGESRSAVDLAGIDFSDVFISHPHRDHFGLIDRVPAQKTVHLGETARHLIATTRLFLNQPPLLNRCRTLHDRTWVQVAPGFRVMPYLMDHSCADAYGFLVEAGGKRLYYSGDFRAHGRRSQAFRRFLVDPPRDIDLLLMEGTMIGRENAAFPDEAAVESGMYGVLRHSDAACFLICSGQHLDRLCAAYRACIRAKRIFVLDLYTAAILRVAAQRFPSLPDIATADNIRVLTTGITARAHYASMSQHREAFGRFVRDAFHPGTMIHAEEISAHPGRYFLKISNFSDLLHQLDRCCVVYSMWSAYLEQPKYRDLRQHPGVMLHKIHTSGHAVRRDLQRFARALQPKRLVPVHTERPEVYGKYFPNVCVLNDGETLHV